MKNFVQIGHTIPVAAPANVKSGDGVLVGSIFGVAAFDAASGDPVEITTVGVFDLPKPDSAVTFSAGAKVFWDNATGLCKASAAGYFPIGVAIADAGATEALVRTRLDGIATTAIPGT